MADRTETLRFSVKTEGGDGLRALGKDIDAVTTAAAKGEPEAQALVEELAKLDEASKAVGALSGLRAALADTGDQLGKAKRRLDELNAEFGETGPKSAKATRELAKASQEVERLAKEETRLSVAVQKAAGTIEKHGLDVANLGKSQEVLANRTQRAGAAVKAFAESAGSAARGTDAVEKSTGRLGRAFDSVRASVNSAVSSLLRVTGIAGAVSSALGAIGVGKLFGGAIDSATEFEAKLSEIRAVSSASSEQLARMKMAAEDATKSTKFTAAEAADALGELARSSGDADKAIAQLSPTLNLAQSASLGTADAARILSTTLTQFGLDASQATHVADLFAKEANSTQDNVLDLGNAMSYVAPLASQLGMSLEDTTAVLGALAEAGFKNERAGTAFRFALTQLLDPASEFNSELRGLGINSKNFSEIVKQLASSGDRGKKALLSLGAEAGPAISALVNRGVPDINRLQDAFKNVAGESARTAQVMGDNFDGASKRILSSLDQLRRDLIDPILEPLKTQFDDVSKRIRAFVETADFATIKAAFKDFALSATDALIQFAKGVNFTEVAEKIRSFVGDAKVFFADLKNNVAGVMAGLSIAGSTISLVFNGIQTVILGASAAIAGALALGARALLKFAEGAASLPGASLALKGTIDKLKDSVAGLDGVTKEFAERTKKNAGETATAFEGLTKAIDEAGAAGDRAAPKIEAVLPSVERSNGIVSKYADDLGIVADYSAKAGESSESLAQKLERLTTTVLPAATGVKGLVKELSQTQQIAAAEVALGKASDTLAELARNGQANTPAFQAAFAAWEQAVRKLQDLKAAAAVAADGTDKLSGSFSDLGIQSQKSLQDAADKARTAFESIRAGSAKTAQGLLDTRNAFIAYAEKALAAVAASDAAAQAQVRNALIGQAAQLGVTAELEKLLATQNQVGPSADEAGRRMQAAGLAGADGFNRARDAAAGANSEIDKTKQKAAAAAQDASVSLTGVAGAVGGVAAAFATTSAAAAKLFADLVQLEGRELSALNFGNAWDAAAGRVNRATAAVQAGIDRQRESLQLAIGVVDEFGVAGEGAMLRVGGNADQAAARIDATILALQQGNSEFTLLGEQELAPLLQALESARSRVQAISEEARTAKSDLAGMVEDLQNQLDQINGNQEAIENRRAQQLLEQLRERAKLAGELGAEDAARAEKLAEEVHQANLKRIRDEAAARTGGGKGGSNPPPPATPRPNGGSGGAGQSAGGGAGGITYNVNLNGTFVGDKDKYVRDLMAEIRRIQQRGG